jgi:hypothetical protein
MKEDRRTYGDFIVGQRELIRGYLWRRYSNLFVFLYMLTSTFMKKKHYF